MVLYFTETDGVLAHIPPLDGVQDAIMSNGHHIVIDRLGHVAEANGSPAKFLEGWDRSIGFKPKETEAQIDRFQFGWRGQHWVYLLPFPEDY